MNGIYTIAPLVLVILLGMALRKCGFLSSGDRETFIKVLYWVALPTLLFRTTYLAGGALSQHTNLLWATYVPLVLVSLIGFLTSLVTHKNRKDLRAFSVMASTRSNAVYLGLPIVMLSMGNEGLDAASIVLAIMLPGQNLISILSGEIIMSGRVSVGSLFSVILKVMKNPLVISCLLGLIASQLGLPVPETVLISCKLVGDMATGVALIVLGAGLELPELFPALKNTWHDVAVKLIIHPAVTLAVFTVCNTPNIMLRAAVIIAAAPTAVNAFIVARGLNLDEQYACETVAISTVLAPVTLTAWLTLLGLG
ncbi:MAG: AEC family transporter [Synergistaceae bacterium]|jgi:predicted permease|nr:AEC family transporter [Synergistaceae bacterium]